MPLTWLRCPDGVVIPVEDCLSNCRMDTVCMTAPTLHAITKERKWTGIPSTTQLLNGTMMEFLKITQPYVVDPQDRAFALLGSRHHQYLESIAKELGLPSEQALGVDGKDIFDLLEPEGDSWVLTDYKTWGSYRVAKALGIVEVGKVPDPSGAVYKVSGKWGKAGTPKMIPRFEQLPEAVDLWETELQLNNYRVLLEGKGLTVGRMQIQVTVRDGGLAVARSRGVERNISLIPIRLLDNDAVKDYFTKKKDNLLAALEAGRCDEPCNERECWEGARCKGYCEVALYCPKGMLYQKGGD